MKKITFIVAALLMTGSAFAQDNGSTVTQDGARNNAFVGQQGRSGEVDQTQSGNDNTAGATQAPDSRFGTIVQIQSGNGNSASASQVRDQGSEVTQEQIGFNNIVSASQSGGFLSRGNETDLANTSDQYQNGQRNNSSVSQRGDGNDAIQETFGNDNTASISQSSATRAGSLAEQEQRGNGNDAAIIQTGNNARGEFNYANQVQNGNDNNAYATQGGDANSSDQFQNGDRNSATVDQQGSVYRSEAIQNQSGNDNRAYTRQDIDGGHFAETNQAGNGNSANTVQGGRSQTSIITQMGTNNVANVKQGY